LGELCSRQTVSLHQHLAPLPSYTNATSGDTTWIYFEGADPITAWASAWPIHPTQTYSTASPTPILKIAQDTVRHYKSAGTVALLYSALVRYGLQGSVRGRHRGSAQAFTALEVLDRMEVDVAPRLMQNMVVRELVIKSEPASFTSLRVKGGFGVSAGYKPPSIEQTIAVTSHTGEVCAILDPWLDGPGSLAVSTDAGVVPVAWVDVLSGNAVVFNTTVGTRYWWLGAKKSSRSKCFACDNHSLCVSTTADQIAPRTLYVKITKP
jgi:hypothetical protein